MSDAIGNFLPIGTHIRDAKTGQRHRIIGDVLEGGGYYLIEAVDPPDGMPAWMQQSRLQPGHIGGLFILDDGTC